MLPTNKTFDELARNIKFAYRKSPVLTVDLFNDVIDLIKRNDGINDGGSDGITGEKIRDLLQSLTEDSRLNAYAIKNIAQNTIVTNLNNEQLTLQQFVTNVLELLGDGDDNQIQISWNDIINRPTKLSQFVNDGDGNSQFITLNDTQILLDYKIDVDTAILDGIRLEKIDNYNIKITTGNYIVNDYIDENIYLLSLDNEQYISISDLDSTKNFAYFAIDKFKNLIIQYVDFSFQDRRNYAIIGYIQYTNNEIDFVNNFRINSISSLHQLHDLITLLGIINMKGNEIVLYNNLHFGKSEGIFFGSGLNFENPLTPNTLISYPQSDINFSYVLEDGSILSIDNNIDNLHYNISNNLIDASINTYVFTKLSMTINQQWYGEYSRLEYNTLIDASLATSNFISNENIKNIAVFSFYLVSKSGITDLIQGYNDGEVLIINDNLSFINGQSNVTYNQVVDALGYVPENVINKVTNLNSPNDITYPTTKAVKDEIDSVIEKSLYTSYNFTNQTNVAIQHNYGMTVPVKANIFINDVEVFTDVTYIDDNVIISFTKPETGEIIIQPMPLV